MRPHRAGGGVGAAAAARQCGARGRGAARPFRQQSAACRRDVAEQRDDVAPPSPRDARDNRAPSDLNARAHTRETE